MKTLTEQEAINEKVTGSLKGYIHASYYELLDILGEPTFKTEGGYKINFEWVVSYKGRIYYVYDWKVYASESLTEPNFKWNVGSDKSAASFILALHKELNKRIRQQIENDQ
jgi:hypothetical protein